MPALQPLALPLWDVEWQEQWANVEMLEKYWWQSTCCPLDHILLVHVSFWGQLYYFGVVPHFCTIFSLTETCVLENVLGFVRVLSTVLDFIKNNMPELLACSDLIFAGVKDVPILYTKTSNMFLIFQFCQHWTQVWGGLGDHRSVSWDWLVRHKVT